MTKPYSITPIWAGETVAIIGNGQNLPADLAGSVQGCRTIALSFAIDKAPWADMLLAIDGNFPASTADHAMRICGVESDVDALYVQMPHEVVTLAPGHVVHIRNNALSAIRIAAQAGAARILLFGMDTERYEQIHNFPGLTVGLATLIVELAERGIVVERIDQPVETVKRKAGKAS
jgi:hypothetical protein